jgi:hypothetical protein
MAIARAFLSTCAGVVWIISFVTTVVRQGRQCVCRTSDPDRTLGRAGCHPEKCEQIGPRLQLLARRHTQAFGGRDCLGDHMIE